MLSLITIAISLFILLGTILIDIHLWRTSDHLLSNVFMSGVLVLLDFVAVALALEHIRRLVLRRRG